MENYLDQLNQQQREAVEYLDGAELVIAGAGSGKTRVLTYKILHLLHQGYEPWRILALTFTNKAAREIRERIEAMLGPNTARNIWMGTFHSVFARILRAHADRLGFKPTFTIYDTADSRSLIKIILRELGLDIKTYPVSAVHSTISKAKNRLVTPADYAASADCARVDAKARRPRMAEIYAMYAERCHVADSLDFDDLLLYTWKLFRDNPDILEQYRTHFRYVLVDEYQDTNYAQSQIIAQLTEGRRNLCVVGDDAQSIYSFRGANIRNILDMERLYPELKQFKLEQNYRSTQNIINAANSLIDKNKDQIRKTIFSRNDVGEKIRVVRCTNDIEESETVANAIFRRRHQTHDSLDEFAILYRTNAQSRMLEENLRNLNLPYRIWGGTSFYQRKEIKDALAYFRLVVNPDDDESLRRIINYPLRGIGDTTLGRLGEAAVENRVSIWSVISDPAKYDWAGIRQAAWRKITPFRDMISRLSSRAGADGGDAFELAKDILDHSGMIQEFDSETTPENISRRENLSELLNGVRQYVDNPATEDTTLAGFLGQASLATDQDTDGQQGERITLMTVHAAKGLEFTNVYIVGVEDEYFPSLMSWDSIAAIEEERRLLYVAMTRAKKYCMMTYTTKRSRNGQIVEANPSRFLTDIDRSLLDAPRNLGREGRTAPLRHSSGGFSSGPRIRFPEPVHNPLPAAPAAPSMPAPEPIGGGRFEIHDISELAPDMRIIHNRFGAGTILSLDPDLTPARITVAFDNSDTKVLILSFSRFQIIPK
ncbi:MAG: UvrD-helicase domain-containing protein [Clostridium sp.]|nr:UvrD-helicase domain-containing protein [Clostridium sp.]